MSLRHAHPSQTLARGWVARQATARLRRVLRALVAATARRELETLDAALCDADELPPVMAAVRAAKLLFKRMNEEAAATAMLEQAVLAKAGLESAVAAAEALQPWEPACREPAALAIAQELIARAEELRDLLGRSAELVAKCHAGAGALALAVAGEGGGGGGSPPRWDDAAALAALCELCAEAMEKDALDEGTLPEASELAERLGASVPAMAALAAALEADGGAPVGSVGGGGNNCAGAVGRLLALAPALEAANAAPPPLVPLPGGPTAQLLPRANGLADALRVTLAALEGALEVDSCAAMPLAELTALVDTADAAGFGAAGDDGAGGARREALSVARVLAARRAAEEGCIGALRDAIKSTDAAAIEAALAQAAALGIEGSAELDEARAAAAAVGEQCAARSALGAAVGAARAAASTGCCPDAATYVDTLVGDLRAALEGARGTEGENKSFGAEVRQAQSMLARMEKTAAAFAGLSAARHGAAPVVLSALARETSACIVAVGSGAASLPRCFAEALAEAKAYAAGAAERRKLEQRLVGAAKPVAAEGSSSHGRAAQVSALAGAVGAAKAWAGSAAGAPLADAAGFVAALAGAEAALGKCEAGAAGAAAAAQEAGVGAEGMGAALLAAAVARDEASLRKLLKLAEEEAEAAEQQTEEEGGASLAEACAHARAVRDALVSLAAACEQLSATVQLVQRKARTAAGLQLAEAEALGGAVQVLTCVFSPSSSTYSRLTPYSFPLSLLYLSLCRAARGGAARGRGGGHGEARGGGGECRRGHGCGREGGRGGGRRGGVGAAGGTHTRDGAAGARGGAGAGAGGAGQVARRGRRRRGRRQDGARRAGRRRRPAARRARRGARAGPGLPGQRRAGAGGAAGDRRRGELRRRRGRQRQRQERRRRHEGGGRLQPRRRARS